MTLTLLGQDAATWTAWGTWLYTLFTFVLAVGAIGAWKSTKKQLREMEKARLDAQRPYVRVVSAVREADEVAIRFRNIGSGPAIGIRVTVWVLGVDTVPETVQELQEVTERLTAIVSSGAAATGEFRIGALGSGEEETIPLAEVPRHKEAAAEAVGALVRYEDIFGRMFAEHASSLQVLGVEDKTGTGFFA